MFSFKIRKCVDNLLIGSLNKYGSLQHSRNPAKRLIGKLINRVGNHARLDLLGIDVEVIKEYRQYISRRSCRLTMQVELERLLWNNGKNRLTRVGARRAASDVMKYLLGEK